MTGSPLPRVHALLHGRRHLRGDRDLRRMVQHRGGGERLRVPCVVTPAGPIDFAEHTNTALVLEAPDPDAIADAVGRLARHPSSMSGIAQRAVVRMRRHSSHDFTRALLDLMDRPRLGAARLEGCTRRCCSLGALAHRPDPGVYPGHRAARRRCGRRPGLRYAARRIPRAVLLEAWPGEPRLLEQVIGSRGRARA
jgi:hypothetical protein